MKSHKAKATPEKNKVIPAESLNTYLDNEVSLIHQNLDELKSFLAQHSALSKETPLETDTIKIDDYYNSTDDLFRQVALETGSRIPFEDLCYDTYLLRKKNKFDVKKGG